MRFKKSKKEGSESESQPGLDSEPIPDNAQTSGDILDSLSNEGRKKLEEYMERIGVWRERGFQVDKLEDMVMEGRFDEFEKTYPQILREQRESILGASPVKKVSLDEKKSEPTPVSVSSGKELDAQDVNDAAAVLAEEGVVTIPGVYVRHKKGEDEKFSIEERAQPEYLAPVEDDENISGLEDEERGISDVSEDDDSSLISEFVDMVGDAGSRISKPGPAVESGSGVYEDISSSLAAVVEDDEDTSTDDLAKEIAKLRSPREIVAEQRAAREKEMTGPLSAVARDSKLCPTCSAVASHRNKIQQCTECAKVVCDSCNSYDPRHKKTHLYYDFVFDFPLCATCYEKDFVIQQQIAKALHSMGNGNLTYAREYLKSATQVDPSSIYVEFVRKLVYKIDHMKAHSRKEEQKWRQTLSKEKGKKKYRPRSLKDEKAKMDDIIWRRKPQA